MTETESARAEMLHFDKRDLCTHLWAQVPQIDLADPARPMPPKSRCVRCDWMRDGFASDQPKFGKGPFA